MSILRFLVALLSGIGASFLRTWQAFRQGKAEGVKETKQDVAEQAVKVSKAAKVVKDEVDALSDADLKRRAGRWVRNPKSTRTPEGH